MNLSDAPVVDTRPLLSREREEFIALLGRLDAPDWARPTSCPGWTVKDVALHVAGDDLSMLSIARDGDLSGRLLARDRDDLVAALNAKNHDWVAANRGLSPRTIRGLLGWLGGELAVYYDGIDLRSVGRVLWAADGPVPMWLDVAQDLTEHWLHQQQIREATGRPGLRDGEWLGIVLRTLMWAVPHHYRSVEATPGTVVAVSVQGAGGGEWSLTRMPMGWALDPLAPIRASGRLALTADDAVRLFAGADVPDGAVTRTGDPALTAPFVSVRGFLV